MQRNFEDKDLDLLFKKRANDSADEPEFEEAAWEDMERRLDKRKRRFIIYYWSVAASLIFLIGLGWMMIPRFYHQQNSTGNKQHIIANKPNKKTQNQANHPVELKAPSTLVIADTTPSKTKKQLEDVQRQELAKTKSETQYPSYAQHQDISKNLAMNHQEGNLTSKSSSKLSPSIIYSNEEESRDNYDLILAEPIIPNYSVNIQPKQILQTEHQGQNGNTKIAPANKRSTPLQWSLGFSAGPELNTAGQAQNGLTTLNSGIALEAQKNKFLFSVGLKYGTKDYNANINQYHRVNPIYAPQVSNIKASCNILEVPFIVSYQPWESKNTSTRLNAGLSSYFMLKEQYTYQYYPASGLADHNVTKINQNQHYFKVLNLSVSQNFKLKNQPFIIGIEPYAKLPLAGVGYGTVKLKSYGINLNFWYGLKKK